MIHLDGPPRGGIDSMESHQAEFFETRIGPLADNIIELVKNVHPVDRSDIVKKIVKWGDEIDSRLGLSLDNFFDSMMIGMGDTGNQQRFKKILTAARMDSTMLYNDLLNLEENLIQEVERLNLEYQKRQDNIDKINRRMNNGK